MFESTSKIPIKEIEKQISEIKEDENKVFSPYTKKTPKVKNGLYLTIYIIINMK